MNYSERTSGRTAQLMQDPDRLFAYGRTYIQRFQPSAGKVRQQLIQKSGKQELADAVMSRLLPFLDDHARARELAEMLQSQGRHARDIGAKLRQRLFSPEVIEQCIAELSAVSGSLLDQAAIARKVAQLQRKGMSQRAMQQKLSGQAADAPVIAAAMKTALVGDNDDHALRLAIAKYVRKNYHGRPLIQRLMAKGFRYVDVTRLVQEMSSSPAAE